MEMTSGQGKVQLEDPPASFRSAVREHYGFMPFLNSRSRAYSCTCVLGKRHQWWPKHCSNSKYARTRTVVKPGSLLDAFSMRPFYRGCIGGDSCGLGTVKYPRMHFAYVIESAAVPIASAYSRSRKSVLEVRTFRVRTSKSART